MIFNAGWCLLPLLKFSQRSSTIRIHLFIIRIIDFNASINYKHQGKSSKSRNALWASVTSPRLLSFLLKLHPRSIVDNDSHGHQPWQQLQWEQDDAQRHDRFSRSPPSNRKGVVATARHQMQSTLRSTFDHSDAIIKGITTHPLWTKGKESVHVINNISLLCRWNHGIVWSGVSKVAREQQRWYSGRHKGRHAKGIWEGLEDDNRDGWGILGLVRVK